MTTLVLHAHPLEESYSAVLRDAVCNGLTASGIDHTLVRLGLGEEPDLKSGTIEHLIAVYPTWWSSPPAVLLDWLQRTLCPIVDDPESFRTSPLASVQHLTVVTTHGSSQLVNTMQGQAGKLTWQRVVLPMCGADTKFDWVSLYKIDRTDHAERGAFVDKVRSHFTTSTVLA